MRGLGWIEEGETCGGEARCESIFHASDPSLFYPTFALKQITFPLFDIVAITQLLIRLSCRCCWFRFIHPLVRLSFVRCHFNVRFVLLIRQTMAVALLNAFTWLWTRTPFTPTAPSWIQNDFESENVFLKREFCAQSMLQRRKSIEVQRKYLPVDASISSFAIHSKSLALWWKNLLNSFFALASHT